MKTIPKQKWAHKIREYCPWLWNTGTGVKNAWTHDAPVSCTTVMICSLALYWTIYFAIITVTENLDKIFVNSFAFSAYSEEKSANHHHNNFLDHFKTPKTCSESSRIKDHYWYIAVSPWQQQNQFFKSINSLLWLNTALC